MTALAQLRSSLDQMPAVATKSPVAVMVAPVVTDHQLKPRIDKTQSPLLNDFTFVSLKIYEPNHYCSASEEAPPCPQRKLPPALRRTKLP